MEGSQDASLTICVDNDPQKRKGEGDQRKNCMYLNRKKIFISVTGLRDYHHNSFMHGQQKHEVIFVHRQ